MTATDGPLIVQSDRTLLLDVDHRDAAACVWRQSAEAGEAGR